MCRIVDCLAPVCAVGLNAPPCFPIVPNELPNFATSNYQLCFSALPVIGLLGYYLNLKSSFNSQQIDISIWRSIKNCYVSGLSTVITAIALVVFAKMSILGATVGVIGVCTILSAFYQHKTGYDVFGLFKNHRL